jgi:hypothetical protein
MPNDYSVNPSDPADPNFSVLDNMIPLIRPDQLDVTELTDLSQSVRN